MVMAIQLLKMSTFFFKELLLPRRFELSANLGQNFKILLYIFFILNSSFL